MYRVVMVHCLQLMGFLKTSGLKWISIDCLCGGPGQIVDQVTQSVEHPASIEKILGSNASLIIVFYSLSYCILGFVRPCMGSDR